MKRIILFTCLLAIPFMHSVADVDPNFYIYLCFGQSNMEGNAQAENMDKANIDSRFRMLATTDFTNPRRSLGQWYAAQPPIVNPVGSLGMADYFGRTMVAALPAEVRVGVVAVAIGGCAIEMFDKDKYKSQMTDPGNWSTQLANNYYGGNPYQRLIDMARKAQEVGVIKGILLHQGESNNGQQAWLQEVKKIYNNMLTDLGLSADSVPLFAGETLRQEYGGACWGHNSVIAQLPSVIPTAHVIHSNDCEGNGKDPWHFCAMGYRIMGKRYAFEALRTMGLPPVAEPDYKFGSAHKRFYMTKKMDNPGDTVMTCGKNLSIPFKVTFQDGHTEDVTPWIQFRSEDIPTADGRLLGNEEAAGSVEAIYTDFTGKRDSVAFNAEIRYFPFSQKGMSSLSGTFTFDEETSTFTISKGGEAGWVYENGVDMSAYKYLVIKLREKQTCGARVKVYPQNVQTSGYSNSITSRTTISIPLDKMRYSVNGSTKTIDPSNIHAISFWCNGGDIAIQDIYLTNNEDLSPTSIGEIKNGVYGMENEAGNVYDLSGRKIVQLSDYPIAKLKPGLYIVNGKLVQKR